MYLYNCFIIVIQFLYLLIFYLSTAINCSNAAPGEVKIPLPLSFWVIISHFTRLLQIKKPQKAALII